MFQTSLKYLGHLITPDGVRIDPERVRVIRDMPRPESLKEAKRIFGLFSWYRKYVPSFSTIAEPLVKLCNAAKFYWDEELAQCFCELKAELCGSRILSYPRRDCPFVLYTDSSSTGSGQVLAQIFPDGEERVIAFGGNRYSRAQRKWTIYELKIFSFIQGVKKWYKYLADAAFTWICDCKSALQILRNKDNINPRLIRWRAFLSQFRFTTEHRRASQMRHVDAISRLHEGTNIDPPTVPSVADDSMSASRAGADSGRSPNQPLDRSRRDGGDPVLVGGGASYGGIARPSGPLRSRFGGDGGASRGGGVQRLESCGGVAESSGRAGGVSSEVTGVNSCEMTSDSCASPRPQSSVVPGTETSVGDGDAGSVATPVETDGRDAHGKSPGGAREINLIPVDFFDTNVS